MVICLKGFRFQDTPDMKFISRLLWMRRSFWLCLVACGELHADAVLSVLLQIHTLKSS